MASFDDFTKLSQSIANDVYQMVQLLGNANTAVHKKSLSPAALSATLTSSISAAIAFKDSHRSSSFYNHMCALAEAAPAWAWPLANTANETSTKKTKEQVAVCKEAAQFYLNRILRDYKDKDSKQAEWVGMLRKLLDDLLEEASSDSSDIISAVGLVVEAKAQPVDTSSQTSKGMETSKSIGGMKLGEPKCLLEGNRWRVENQSNAREISIEITELQQSVYLYNCVDSIIQIHGKSSAITIDHCKRTGLVAEEVVATIELIHCEKTQLQITGRAPSVSIESCEEIQVFLSKPSYTETEIMTAESRSVNVCVPKENDEDEMMECPIPVQFKSRVLPGGKMVTEPVQHAGA